MASDVECALSDGSPDTAARLLTHALSTITSPAFSEVTIFYSRLDIRRMPPGVYSQPLNMTPIERAKELALGYSMRFKVVHKMYTVRAFRLVLGVLVRYGWGTYIVKVLKDAVAAERAKNGLDYLPQDVQYRLTTMSL